MYFKNDLKDRVAEKRRVRERERDREPAYICWFTPQKDSVSEAELIQSQEPLLCFPCVWRGPKTWALLCSIPSTLAEVRSEVEQLGLVPQPLGVPVLQVKT